MPGFGGLCSPLARLTCCDLLSCRGVHKLCQVRFQITLVPSACVLERGVAASQTPNHYSDSRSLLGLPITTRTGEPAGNARCALSGRQNILPDHLRFLLGGSLFYSEAICVGRKHFRVALCTGRLAGISATRHLGRCWEFRVRGTGSFSGRVSPSEKWAGRRRWNSRFSGRQEARQHITKQRGSNESSGFHY